MSSSAESERWRQLSQLFDRAIDLDPQARRHFIERECAHDPVLRDELETMLAADDVDALLDIGAAGIVDADLLASAPRRQDDEDQASVGLRLGHWQLEHVLGRGGMGTVYAARRDDQDARDRDGHQRAAVKRLHRRWDGSLQAQRFLQERRILVALSHPHLPKLIDHGLDGEGRPWFALEFVDGPDLVTWADAQRLDLRARIALFRAVCAAVQHAHERFVVHRDLKPANILVDGDGHPKVLDFGVAKRMDEAHGTTRTGAFAGFTPEYAAPEQISGGAISASTDVYALGVILYQLLTGRLPYHVDHDDLRAATETISSRTAERMEKALATGTPDDIAARVARRDTSLPAFRRFVRGDLTRIVQTALAKEPARRYASVQAFSTDLGRFLEGRTVSVSGDTALYRSGKFVRRNAIAVAVVSVFALALLASTFHAFQRERAERLQRQRAETTLVFMRDIFDANTPDNTDGARLTAMQLLDRAGQRIDGYFPDDPLARAQLLGELGDVYSSLTLHDKAIPFLARAVDVLRDSRDEHPDLYARRVVELAQAYRETYAYDDVLALADRELPTLRGMLVDGEPAYAQLLTNRSDALAEAGRTRDAERDLREAIALYEQASASGTASYAQIHSDLGYLLLDTGRLREALRMFQRTRVLVDRAPGSTKLQKLVSRFSVGLAYSRLGDYARAIPILAAVMPQYEQLLGAASNRTMITRSQLAQAHSANGDYARALALIERNLQAVAASGIADPRDRIEIGLVKAKVLGYSLRADAAMPLVREADAYIRANMRESSFSRGRMQWIVGEIELQAGDCASAEPVLAAALADALATSDTPSNPNVGEVQDSLGRCRMQAGDFDGALDRFGQAVAGFEAELGVDHPRTVRSRLHRSWALALKTRDPAVLAGMAADRQRMVLAVGSADKPVIWQLDLLIDAIARTLDAPHADAARLARARAGLAALAGTTQVPVFVGLNSFS